MLQDKFSFILNHKHHHVLVLIRTQYWHALMYRFIKLLLFKTDNAKHWLTNNANWLNIIYVGHIHQDSDEIESSIRTLIFYSLKIIFTNMCMLVHKIRHSSPFLKTLLMFLVIRLYKSVSIDALNYTIILSSYPRFWQSTPILGHYSKTLVFLVFWSSFMKEQILAVFTFALC